MKKYLILILLMIVFGCNKKTEDVKEYYTKNNYDKILELDNGKVNMLYKILIDENLETGELYYEKYIGNHGSEEYLRNVNNEFFSEGSELYYEGLILLEKAMKKGSLEAKKMLVEKYVDEDGKNIYIARALELLKELGENDDEYKIRLANTSFLSGRYGYPPDFDLVRKSFEELGIENLGDSEKLKLGIIYNFGLGAIDKEIERAKGIYESLEDKSVKLYSDYFLSKIYLEEGDLEKGNRLLKDLKGRYDEIYGESEVDKFKVMFEEEYDFVSTISVEKFHDREIFIPVLKSKKNYQKVEEITTNPEPYKIFVEKDVNAYKYLNSNGLDEIKIEIKGKIKKNRYSNWQENNNKELGDEKLYLSSYKNLNMESEELKSLAKRLRGKNKDETIANIYNYVRLNIEYDYKKSEMYYSHNKGAEDTLINKKGICGDYSELMVSLLRINNIPVKFISGYRGEGHSWIEVYTGLYGWVPFDPTQSNNGYLTTGHEYIMTEESDRFTVDIFNEDERYKDYLFTYINEFI